MCRFEAGDRMAEDVVGTLEVYDDVGNVVMVIVEGNVVLVKKIRFGVPDEAPVSCHFVNDQIGVKG